jgi:signal transduction histidine kinase
VAQTAATTAEVRYGVDDEGTRAALAEIEAMLEQLRAEPLENAGLAGAVKDQCEALGLRTGAKVEFVQGAMPKNEDMPPGAQQAMYRVAQEALANLGRHARARNVEVRLERTGNEVRLRVADDGAGFDANTAARGMGLRNMRVRAEEHGGALDLVSHPGGGTVVELRIPCAA